MAARPTFRTKYLGVAQLEECLPWTQEAVGANPTTLTK